VILRTVSFNNLIADGVRNISNKLTIGTHFDLSSAGVCNVACRNGWWDVERDGPLNWAKAFSIPRMLIFIFCMEFVCDK